MKTSIFQSKLLFALALLIISAIQAAAQTTAFNYQGKLNDAGNPANGSYQLQFKLFDAAAGGEQFGATISDVAVTAAQGVFNTRLDFGAAAFDGGDRFLEIAVKKNAGDSYTVLSPRQQINSSPYAIQSKNATTADTATDTTKLGGIAANQYVTTMNAGNSFVKNSTTQQAGANFNIGGNGVVGGNFGVGTTGAGSKLTVAGVIESTSGGLKFPDATTQTTAGLTVVITKPTLTGNGTSASPLDITSPLSVRDIDNPAFQPFQASANTSGAILVTVPAGKRLVIEFVSGSQVVPSSTQTDGSIQIRAGGIFAHYATPLSVRPSGNNNTVYSVSQPMRMYVSAGQQLQVFFSGAAILVNLNVTGYYVNVP